MNKKLDDKQLETIKQIVEILDKMTESFERLESLVGQQEKVISNIIKKLE